MSIISPAQCRAARALLNWSRDQLETRSKVAKKTIADFERGACGRLLEATEDSLSKAFLEAGIDLIAQDGGGDGVRFRRPVPRFAQLFRRDNIEQRNWVTFAFDYKNERRSGVVKHDALGIFEESHKDPLAVFDQYQETILMCAASKFDRSALDPEGRALIRFGELDL